MKLAQLVAALRDTAAEKGAPGAACQDGPTGDTPEIAALFYRAQDVVPGGLFIAIKGHAADGHDYIEQAVERGAVAVVCERSMACRAIVIRVGDSRKAMAALASRFYHHPSRHMTIVGITGTNGKTTTSYLIESMLAANAIRTGVIGTINYRYGGQCYDNPVTTPESLDLQRILADMRASGVTHVVMEVSSHALDLHRVHGCDVDVAVFTNLTQDHLDFHKDMDAYWASKQRLFTDRLRASAGKTAVRAVINADDPRGRQLAGSLDQRLLTTGLDRSSNIRPEAAHIDRDGIRAHVHTPQGGFDFQSGLTGRHNLENILNAVGAGIALGLPLAAIQSGIENLNQVPGRLERVAHHDAGRFIYVDYAHTPDALENVLQALRSLTLGRLICVFGCGGGRDHPKRPLMGAIAARLADLAIVTSDNPRTEAPDAIIAQIVAGLQHPSGPRQFSITDLTDGFDGKGYAVVSDRREAINLSVRVSRAGDTILIAGKGHEPYQIIGRQKYPFDDRHVAQQALEAIQ